MYGYFYAYHRKKLGTDLYFRTQESANKLIPILDPLLDNDGLFLRDNDGLVLTDNG